MVNVGVNIPYMDVYGSNGQWDWDWWNWMGKLEPGEEIQCKKKNEKPSHKELPMPFYQTGNFIPETSGWMFWSEKSWLPSEHLKTPGSPQYMGQDRATCWGHPGVHFSPWSLQHTPFHHVVTGPNVRSESIVGWLGRCGSHVESGGKVRKCSYMKKGWEHGRLRIEDPSFGDVILGWFQRFPFPPWKWKKMSPLAIHIFRCSVTLNVQDDYFLMGFSGRIIVLVRAYNQQFHRNIRL